MPRFSIITLGLLIFSVVVACTNSARPTPAPSTDTPVLAADSSAVIVPTATPAVAVKSLSTASILTRPEPLHDDAEPFRQMALDLINGYRNRSGLGDLIMGDSVAAQAYADGSLEALDLLDFMDDRLPAEMLYTSYGGLGYIQSGMWISGYFDESTIADCRSPRVICSRVDAEEEVFGYIDGRIKKDISEGPYGIISDDWNTLHLGIAYTDLTFVIAMYLERRGFNYAREPIIRDGFISLQAIMEPGQNIRNIQVYRHLLPSDLGRNRNLDEFKVLSIFEPPRSGFSLTLKDEESVVADYWVDDGETVEIVIILDDRISEPGVYELVIWDEAEIPASQYFINLDDPKYLEFDLAALPFEVPEPPSLEKLRLYALDLINIDRKDHGVPAVKLGTNESA
jgi:hypothetical protein